MHMEFLKPVRGCQSAITLSVEQAYASYIPPTFKPFTLVLHNPEYEEPFTIKVHKEIKFVQGRGVYEAVWGGKDAIVKYWGLEADCPDGWEAYAREILAHYHFGHEQFMPWLYAHGTVTSGLNPGFAIITEKRAGSHIGKHLAEKDNSSIFKYSQLAAITELDEAVSKLGLEGMLHPAMFKNNILWDDDALRITILGWQNMVILKGEYREVLIRWEEGRKERVLRGAVWDDLSDEGREFSAYWEGRMVYTALPPPEGMGVRSIPEVYPGPRMKLPR
ncbi:hypothetical protein TWF730_003635 [Orbilia blumenaviensis]|uniref:Protein kinase domain-containing protein n=1 Tax=Orbilia blumenaviensis TaxID=1796055 RepID=A0AAV9U510_9PEZI